MRGVKLGNKGNIVKDKGDNSIVQANLDINLWTNKTKPINPVSLGIAKLKKVGRTKLGNEGNIQEQTSGPLRKEIKKLTGWKKKKEETSETLKSNGLREWKRDPGEIRQISILYSKIPMITMENPLKTVSNLFILRSICFNSFLYLISFAKDRKKEFKGTRKEAEMKKEELLLQKTNYGENKVIQKGFINSQNTGKLISTEKVK